MGRYVLLMVQCRVRIRSVMVEVAVRVCAIKRVLRVARPQVAHDHDIIATVLREWLIVVLWRARLRFVKDVCRLVDHFGFGMIRCGKSIHGRTTLCHRLST